MDQGGTCDFVLDGDPHPLPKRGVPLNSRPTSIWPNGCMNQDATWYGDRPRPTRHCVRCGPSFRQKKRHIHPTQFLAHVYCGQTAGWMKTPLGTEVDLGPGHIVLDGVPTLRERGITAPLFWAHVYCGHGRPSQQLLNSCSDFLLQMNFPRLLTPYRLPSSIRTDSTDFQLDRIFSAIGFRATVCKTVRPTCMLSDRCLSVCPVLPVALVYCGQAIGHGSR